MKVSELKRLLTHVPDDANVVVRGRSIKSDDEVDAIDASYVFKSTEYCDSLIIDY